MSNPPKSVPPKSIPFIDLQAQRRRIAPEIARAISEIVEGGAYILGPPVRELEAALSALTGASHTVSCANGTDALNLPLMAWGIGPGDAVFCPSFTFAATAGIIALTGATPVFVDIDEASYNIDPAHLEKSIQSVLADKKLTPRVIIAVDLFGQLADYPAISEIAKKYALKLISDCAQGFGATLNNHHSIAWADVVTTSFFPAKPLGCYGDGGALQTNDASLADKIISLRMHGQANDADCASLDYAHAPKYLNVRIGINSRLDSIQAAILLEKLKIFEDEIERRNVVAQRYNEHLQDVASQVPSVIDGARSVWAQYTIETEHRDGLGDHLRRQGIPSAIYYPVPMHQQKAYARHVVVGEGLPVTERKADRVISLPMHPYLDEATQDRIIDGVKAFNAHG